MSNSKRRGLTRRTLIKGAGLAAAAGSVLKPLGALADEGGAGPEFATLFGLNMMLTAPDGGVHADEDVSTWLVDAGFGKISRAQFPAPMPHRVVTGIRS